MHRKKSMAQKQCVKIHCMSGWKKKTIIAFPILLPQASNLLKKKYYSKNSDVICELFKRIKYWGKCQEFYYVHKYQLLHSSGKFGSLEINFMVLVFLQQCGVWFTLIENVCPQSQWRGTWMMSEVTFIRLPANSPTSYF